MRLTTRVSLVVGLSLGLAACGNSERADVERAMDSMNVIDETNLNDIMLTVADPDEAVTYFRRATREQPDRLDLQRGLGHSLIRAGRAAEAGVVWRDIAEHPEATAQDRVDYADALIRNSDWDQAEAQLDLVPPTFETYERYRLEAMVADSNQEWSNADSFYETAVGLTTRPASVLNNWGFSKLTRGDTEAAERLFTEAITYDPDLFTAKNNLVLARAARGNYNLPLVQMTQIERAQLLHTAALAAIRQGDVDIGRGLLAEAIDTHPQHFDAAVRALRALDTEVRN
ncbi:tetratricopeptide repeat protein [Roseobacter sp. HKCCD9010]|uniref:tetratricopeptide repeat protein n=1 Tax=unclassified Roseobacter TaxID=196798 RepID=UPI0014916D49|nr:MULTISPECIES: tetratricopeptide repeat protein [unclassified Roseobacter]MBF9049135.1 tetratricopeptide repeat protein [Rhodobacterales bacterium HKCCD4356]NNV11135.1 tetratricopeptide repeat protein [Roseobacter sp. HKCCD7357]NNV15319.1 tetratricopeptide repeat protein [Roseobacter sp. HKCCD8768]NNV24779.1 tetratricopeptide repeat protein [Roseobacter sp. HKCCD8192]NNV29035.1 tetratricopeptide repeat protein [Roseobacter sp. HKCCD9061]